MKDVYLSQQEFDTLSNGKEIVSYNNCTSNVRLMEIEATFFPSQGEKTSETRKEHSWQVCLILK